MIEVLTIGEPMALLVADEVKPLEKVEHFTRYACGAELNFAIGMARLNHKVAYITRIGSDPFGKFIKQFLNDNKIDNRYATIDDNYLTGMMLKSKVMSGDPEIAYFRKNTAFTHVSKEDTNRINWETVKHIHVTGIPPALSASCRTVIYDIMEIARSKNVKVSFDPNLRPSLWKDKQEMISVMNDLAARCHIFLPGLSEAQILTGLTDPDTVADFYLKLGVNTVIMKTGAEGAFVKTPEKSFKVPAFKVEKIIDTVGAGDGFAVGVVSALLEGLSLEEVVRRGAAIGALAIMSPGDNEGLPVTEELMKFMNAN